MRALIQKVSRASVTVNDSTVGAIEEGLLVLLGVEEADQKEDVQWLANKIANMRVFLNEEDKMDKSVLDIKGQILLVSQFTLHASTKKGHRPSFTKSAAPEVAEPMYRDMARELQFVHNCTVETGAFGEMMKVDLCNEGPVTIMVDSKIRE